jgi:hypothetical protein
VTDLSEEQEFLLARAIANFGALGIPTSDTLAASGASMRDQQVVRKRLEEMSAGVLG